MLPKRTTADKRSPPRMTNERVPPHNCGSSRTWLIKRGSVRSLARSLIHRCRRLLAHRNVSEMHICESGRAAIARSDNNKADECESSQHGHRSVSLHTRLNFDLRGNERSKNLTSDHKSCYLKIRIPISKVALYRARLRRRTRIASRDDTVLPSSPDRALAKTGGGIR